MANKMENIVNTLTDIIDDKNKTQAYEVEATVVRIDGNTAWVHIPGGVDETPVQLTIAANVGDMVHVRVANGRATLSGNYTAPPTDDTMAIAARTVAKKAQATAQQAQEVAEGVAGTAAQALSTANDAETLAQAAQEIAEATNQHFWVHPTSGAIYITTQEQDDYLTAPSGRALLITTEGMLMQEQTTEGGATTTTLLATFTDDGTALYQDGKLAASMTANGIVLYGADGVTAIAQFATNGVQIGQTGQTRTNIDFHSLKLIDKEQSTYFHVSDLREANGFAPMIDYFTGDGDTTEFYTSCPFEADVRPTVTVNGSTVTAFTINGTGAIIFNSAPIDGAKINIAYNTASDTAKAFTFGKRKSNVSLGAYSYSEGYNNQASGLYSHAEGVNSVSTANASHSEGYGATASAQASHAEGYYTEATGFAAHSEGEDTSSTGYCAHCEGYGATASADYSHAQNRGTLANYENQTAIGRFNRSFSNYAFMVGNGTSYDNRSNAYTVDWSGNSDQQGRATTEDMTAAEVSDFINGLDFSAATLVDFIVEQGEGYGANNVKGYYRKWNSGKCEFWYDWSAASGMTTAVWAAPIYFVDTSAFSTVWNGLFTAKPTNLQISSTNSQLINVYAWDYDAQGINKLRLLTCIGKTGAAYSFSLYAVGTWK